MSVESMKRQLVAYKGAGILDDTSKLLSFYVNSFLKIERDSQTYENAMKAGWGVFEEKYLELAMKAPQGLNPKGVQTYYQMTGLLGDTPEEFDKTMVVWIQKPDQRKRYLKPGEDYVPATEVGKQFKKKLENPAEPEPEEKPSSGSHGIFGGTGEEEDAIMGLWSINEAMEKSELNQQIMINYLKELVEKLIEK